MIPIRLARLLKVLQSETPEYPVIIRPYTRIDDPGIGHFVHILGVPANKLTSVADRAWDLVFEAYDDAPVPFHLTALTPETSATFFSAEYPPAVRPHGIECTFDHLLVRPGNGHRKHIRSLTYVNDQNMSLSEPNPQHDAWGVGPDERKTGKVTQPLQVRPVSEPELAARQPVGKIAPNRVSRARQVDKLLSGTWPLDTYHLAS